MAPDLRQFDPPPPVALLHPLFGLFLVCAWSQTKARREAKQILVFYRANIESRGGRSLLRPPTLMGKYASANYAGFGTLHHYCFITTITIRHIAARFMITNGGREVSGALLCSSRAMITDSGAAKGAWPRGKGRFAAVPSNLEIFVRFSATRKTITRPVSVCSFCY